MSFGPRVYIPFDDECHFCSNRAEWTVYADSMKEDEMQVCDDHKTTAFS
jgi:predicted DCC family thiol-disulfide oxidoreductase YuxK